METRVVVIIPLFFSLQFFHHFFVVVFIYYPHFFFFFLGMTLFTLKILVNVSMKVAISDIEDRQEMMGIAVQ